jgi:hypothetical protein
MTGDEGDAYGLQTVSDYYYSFIEKDYQAIPPETMEHLRSCPTCRGQIERLEQALDAPGDTQPSLVA